VIVSLEDNVPSVGLFFINESPSVASQSDYTLTCAFSAIPDNLVFSILV
jgi:hypothetical protein